MWFCFLQKNQNTDYLGRMLQISDGTLMKELLALCSPSTHLAHEMDHGYTEVQEDPVKDEGPSTAMGTFNRSQWKKKANIAIEILCDLIIVCFYYEHGLISRSDAIYRC